MSLESSLDLDEIYEFAVRIGKEAGAMLQRAAEARFGDSRESKHIEKENAVDLVTQTDIGKFCCVQRSKGHLGTLSIACFLTLYTAP